MLKLWRLEAIDLLHQKHTGLLGGLLLLTMLLCYPFFVSPNAPVFTMLLPAMVWFCCLLVCVWLSEQLFAKDATEQVLTLICLHADALAGWVMIRIVLYWLIMILPLVLLGSGLAYLQGAEHVLWLLLSLGLGSFTLLMLASLPAALLVNVQFNRLLLPILILPLATPVIIFAMVLATSHDAAQVLAAGCWLGALCVSSAVLFPFITAKALLLGNQTCSTAS